MGAGGFLTQLRINESAAFDNLSLPVPTRSIIGVGERKFRKKSWDDYQYNHFYFKSREDEKKSESKESGFDPDDRNGLDPITNKINIYIDLIFTIGWWKDIKGNLCQRLEKMTEILHGRGNPPEVWKRWWPNRRFSLFFFLRNVNFSSIIFLSIEWQDL